MYSTFYNNYSIKSVNFPECITIEGYAFCNCSNLTTISFPKCTTIDSETFNDCSRLTVVSFPKCTSIGSFAFAGCYRLSRIYLRGSVICSINHNTFLSTPFDGYSTYYSGTPYIYVPSSLLTAYKSARYWSYYSKYIKGI